MSIIYEVNIEVDQSIASDFKAWLKQHIQALLAIDGFESATLLKELSISQKRWCVHYTVSSIAKLEAYFSQHAEKMRQQALDKFGDLIQIHRRILQEDG